MCVCVVYRSIVCTCRLYINCTSFTFLSLSLSLFGAYLYLLPPAVGLATDIVMVESPIALAFSSEHRWVFVSSKAKHREGMIVVVSYDTYRVVKVLRTEKMTHPTGLALLGDSLFVAEQFLGNLYVFDIVSGQYKKVNNTCTQCSALEEFVS